MEPFVKLLALFAVFLCVQSVPLQQVVHYESAEGVSSCASRCRSDPHLIRYSPGKSYYYRFETQTYLEESPSQDSSPISLEGAVVVSALSDCHLALQLERVRIAGVQQLVANEMQRALESSPLHFGYNDGVVTDVCLQSRDEQQWTLNVKKAIVSALQMASPSLSQRQRVEERDVQGMCVTQYEPMSERFGKHVIKKTKNFYDCEGRQQWITGLFPRAYSRLNQIPLIGGQQECVQSIESDLIFGVTCQESQRVFGNQLKVKSSLNLRFEKQLDQLVIDNRQQTYYRHRNHLKMGNNFQENNQQQLEPLLRSLCQRVTSQDNYQQSSEEFSRLVQSLQRSSPEQIQRVYEKIQSKEICQQQKLIEDLFLDANANSGTKASIQILKKALQQQQNSLRSQLIFRNLAFVSQPEPEALQPLVDILQQNTDKQHVVYGISSYIHNLKHVQRDNQQVQREEERAINALLPKATSGGQSQQIQAIKALQNIGLERNQRARQQLAQLAQSQSTPEGVRVAALKTLSDVMNGEERNQVIKVLENPNNSNEIRLNAFKALVMSGSSQQEMERIKQLVDRASDQNIKQYARSLIQNLKETSDPHKKDILRRIGDVTQWTQATNQWIGISNNFETSFMLDAIGVGAVMESDVIYEERQRAVPTSVTLNVTLPVLGREVNLIEVEIRQKGFESVFEKKFQEVYRSVQQKNSRQVVDAILRSVQNLKNEIHSENAFFEVNVKVDAKTVLSFNSRDNSQDLQQLYRQLSQQSLEGAFAFQPINTRVHIPSANGWPIVARVNSTFLAHMQSRDSKQVSPSFVWQTEAGLELQANQESKRVGVAFNVQSAPKWQSIVDYSQNSISMKLSIPEQRVSLLKTEAEVRQRDGSRGLFAGNSYSKCTQWTRKAFGFEVCFEKNNKKMEIFIQKTDSKLQTIELQATRQQQQIHVQFNTPNSEVDRHWEAEIQLTNQSADRGLKMALRSPFYRLNANALLRLDEKEQLISGDVTSDQKKYLEFEFGLEQMQRGQKREFRPKVKLIVKNQEVLQVGGSVSVAKGRKNQLMINLEGNQKQFLKGSLVREGDRKSSDIRVSSDLSFHLMNGLEAKVNALFDKSAKHVTGDLQLEYRAKNGRKESLKTSVKLQSLGSQNAQKLSAFGELTSTQFPHLNLHVAYNVLNKPSEHVENELTVQWNQQLSQKIHLLQVTKVTSQSVETTLNIEVTPLKVDYELRLNGQKTNQETSVSVQGKDRSGKWQQYDVKGQVEYKQVQFSPLHLTLSANVKNNGREFIYNDELKEVNKNQYKGETSVQWTPRQGDQLKMAKMDYEYKKKADMDHEMQLMIQSPLTKKPIKHSALLRMSRHQLHLKSRLSIGDQLNHHLETLLDKEGESRVHYDVRGYQVKAHLNPYQLPQRAALEVVHTPSQVIHKTEVEIVPKNSFRLKSDTKQRNANIFALESDISRQNPSKVIFNSNQLEGRFNYQTGSEHLASVNLNHLLNDWTHSSTVKVIPQQKTIEIQSKTIKSGQPLMTLNSILNRNQQKINFLLPTKQTSVVLDSTSGQRFPRSSKLEVNCGQNLRHLSEYSQTEPQVHQFLSQQTDYRSGSPLYSIEYKKNQLNHRLNGHLNQNYIFDSELNYPRDSQGSLLLNLKNKRSQTEHNTKISLNNNIYKLESQTRSNGNPLLSLDGHYNQLTNQESQIKINIPRSQTRAHLIVTPSTGAKLQYFSPNADHVTSLEWAAPQYSLDSKTTLGNHVTYALAGNHSPNRKSFISLKTPSYDVSGHVDRAFETPSAKVTVITPTKSHQTEVSLNRNRKSIRVESRTDRKSGPEVSENIYNLDSHYNHLNEEIPSTLGLKIAKNWKVNAKLQAFARNKYLQFVADHPLYNHVTDLALNGQQHVTIKSRTQDNNGRNLAKIDSYIPLNNWRNEKSHVTFVSPSIDTSLQLEPLRSAKFEYRSPQWTHATTVAKHVSADGVSVASETKYQGKQYFDLNSDFKHAIGQQEANLVFKTPNIQHQSHVTRAQHAITLNSNTDYENQVLNKISFDSRKQLDLHLPQFTAQTQWSRDGATVDYRSRLPQGRHLLASVRMPRGQNQFGVDIAWDQQRDPNQRLKVDLESRDVQNRAIHEVRLEYAGNELKVTSDVQKRNVVYGPNNWSVKYTPKYNQERDTVEVRASHVINNNQMECHVQYLEGQQEKLGTKLVTKWRQDEVEVQFESTSPSNPDLNTKLDLKSRVEKQNQEISTEISFEQNKKEYSAEFRVSRAQQSSADVIKGQMTLETPSSGRQEMDFRLNVKEQEIEFNAKSKDRKLLEVNARADLQRGEEKHVTFNLKSNIRDIPSVSVSGDYFRSKQLSLRAEVDGQRAAEVSLTRTGSDISSGSQVTFLAETQFTPKLESILSLKKNSKELEFEFNSKLDAKQVFSAVIKANKSSSGVWTGSARISESGSQLAQLEAESTSGPIEFKYQVEAKSSRRFALFGPIRFLFSLETGNQKTGNRVKVNACRESENTCFDLNGIWKIANRMKYFPERAELNVQKNGKSFELKSSFFEQLEDHSSGQSVFGLSSGKVQQKTRNQMFIAINGHQMGFEETQVNRGRHSQENYLKVEFPNQKQLEFKSDFFKQSNQWNLKTQVIDSNKQEVIVEAEVEAQDTQKEIRWRAEAKSKKFGRNKSKKVEFWFQKPSQELKIDFRSKLVIDVQNNQNPITIESYLERKPLSNINNVRQQRYLWQSSNQLNNSLHFSINDKQKIDFQINIHANQQTAGFELRNKNRQGRQQFAHLYIQSEPSSGQEKRFQAIASTNQKRYKVEGAWLNNEVNYQITDEKSGEKSDVRVALKQKCVEWESRSQRAETLKYDICLNYDNKNDESLQLALTETSSNGQSRQLNANLEVDTRGQQSVKIDVTWTPELLNQLVNEAKRYYSSQWNSNYVTEIVEEVVDEVIEKYSLISEMVTSQVLIPVSSLFSDQFQDLIQEFEKHFANLDRVYQYQQQLMDALYRQYQRLSSHVSHSLSSLPSLDSWFRPLTRGARKQCQKYELCYKLLYGLEKYGVGAIYDYFQWNSVRLLKESHRLVVATSGRVFLSLPVPQFVQQYKDELKGVWQSIIESNPTLQSIVDTIEQLMREVSKEFDQIDGQQVKKSLRKLFDIVLDVSAQRVVVWDPARGRFSAEIKSSNLRRQLRSVKNSKAFSKFL